MKDWQHQKQLAHLGVSISKYYDSLSQDEMNDDRLWGDFALRQFLWVEK